MTDTSRERDGIRRVEGKHRVRWQAKAAVNGVKPAYKTFPTRTAALRWKKSTEAAMLERRHFTYAEADKHTLGEMIQRYLDSETPVNSMRLCLLTWQENLGKRRLSEITPADIVEYRDSLRKGWTSQRKKRAPATVNRHLAYLSSVYSTAIREWQWVSLNPVKAVKKLSEPKGRVRYLDDKERVKLLATCRKSDSANLYPLVVLALSCGARVGELLDLQWRDVDLNQGRATLHNTKNGERRSISIKGKAHLALKEHSKIKRLDTDQVFPSVNGIKRYDYSQPFREAVKQAEIIDFRFHDLRHTCASYLAMNGASIPEIAAVLGHKSWAVTQRYSHLSDSHISDVVERMNERVLGAE